MLSEEDINQIFEERFSSWVYHGEEEDGERIKDFLRKVYPHHSNLGYKEGTTFDKIARKGLLRNVSFKEAMDHGNVLSPREYSVLSFFLNLMQERKLFFDGVVVEVAHIDESDLEEAEERLGFPCLTEQVKPSYWTSEGIGKVEKQKVPIQYSDRTVWAEIERANRRGVYVNLEKAVVVDDLRSRFEDAQNFIFVDGEIEDWELQPNGVYLPLGNQRIVSKPLGAISLAEDYESFRPWVYSTNQRVFGRSREKKNRALVCLNKDGNNPDFPETVEELVVELAKDCIQDEEKISSKSYLCWFEREKLKSYLNNWWQEEDDPFRSVHVFPELFSGGCRIKLLSDSTETGFEQLIERLGAGEYVIGLDSDKVYGLLHPGQRRDLYLLRQDGLELW